MVGRGRRSLDLKMTGLKGVVLSFDESFKYKVLGVVTSCYLQVIFL